jgi:hypothetical protein
MRRMTFYRTSSGPKQCVYSQIPPLSVIYRVQDMDAVKDQLRKCKQENYALEADLRCKLFYSLLNLYGVS